MDVHRCRFVPYEPSAINAVAFSHPKPKSSKYGAIARLAVGRANGDIEIWNSSNARWHQELVIRGGKDRSIDGLAWINEPDQDLGDGRVVIGKSRLFSIGYTSSVTEWDLEKGKPKRHATGQHGDIWCIATQPAGNLDGQNSNKLIAGTIDGELVMYTAEDDGLRFQRMIVKSPTKKAQMVSIAFQSRKVVIVGCSDSTIRAYEITKGHMLRRMTLGSDLAGGAKDIIVWSVKCLPNGDIVSGDSTGQVCIWDGKTYTQAQRLNSHKQDVLSLVVSADGTTVMSGGMDRRTVLYKQNNNQGGRWSKVWGRRYHNHDVKAMASYEMGMTSVVVSGGPDSCLVVVPLKEMGRENHRVISNLPQQPPLMSARNARFVVSWWDREVHIWTLRQSADDVLKSSEQQSINQNRKLLKTIVVKGDSNIASATISQDGTLLIVSTATDIKAFKLRHNQPLKASDVKISSVSLPAKLTRLGATSVQLSLDEKWLLVVQEGSRVVVAALDSTQDGDGFVIGTQRVSRLRRDIPRYIRNGGLGSFDRNITNVAFSADSRMIAVADLAGFLDTWVLQPQTGKLTNGTSHEEEDDAASSESDSDSSEDESPSTSTSSPGKWVKNPKAKLLPKLPASPVALSFSDDVPDEKDANDDYTLVAITSAWNVIAFHPRQGSLTPWARRHPRKALPAPVQDLLDIAKGVFWEGSRLWIYGVSFLTMLDLNQDLPLNPTEKSSTDVTQAQRGLKRKRVGPSTGAGGKMERTELKPSQIQKYKEGQWVEIEKSTSPRDEGDDSDSDEEMIDGPDNGLAQLRNAEEDATALAAAANGDGEPAKWWITYKYRPVLGVVPLVTAQGSVEVALVERPTWDVEMQDSYFVAEEWEKN